MSPKNKIKLNLLRKKLDVIDYQLLKLIKKRTEIVKKVLTLKAYKNEIVDKKRIATILKKIKKESLKRNIDPKITKSRPLKFIAHGLGYSDKKYNFVTVISIIYLF